MIHVTCKTAYIVVVYGEGGGREREGGKEGGRMVHIKWGVGDVLYLSMPRSSV